MGLAVGPWTGPTWIGTGTIALLVLAGLAIWTLAEYWLHRKVFHWDPDHPIGHRLHFIIHGVHHDHPNDKLRLVMPPGASIPLALLFFGAFWLIFGSPAAYPLFAGFLVGSVVGLTGMGGGALMTPLLVLVFGVEPLSAVSSDIVASLIMKPVGAGVHWRRSARTGE